LISRKTYFFTDLHADKKAFLKSLDFCNDKDALYLIGGDCLDKGPSNLELLTEIKNLSASVEVKLLAGNHDIRMLMVLLNWERQDNPKLKKIFTPARLEKRINPFLTECGGIEKAKKMFLSPEGEFSWFFDSLDILHRDHEFLFVHAGVSDAFVSEIKMRGENSINRRFKFIFKKQTGLHDFYYGPCGAAFRTKYRKEKDFTFTKMGAENLKDCGIKYIVHGHSNQISGHQVKSHQNIMHIMCDCSINVGTRQKIGLDDKSGYAVAIFDNKTDVVVCHSSEGDLEVVI